MKAVSTIIVAILLLMISVAMTGLGYIFFTNIYTGVTTKSEETISRTVTIMLSGMKIESIYNITPTTTNISIRNTGKVDLTKFSAYRNDTFIATSNGATLTITPGGVGTLNLNIAILSGEKIQVTSAEGATAMYVK